MNPLQENIKQNLFPSLSESRKDIIVHLQETKKLVNGAIRNMRTRQEIVVEKRRQIIAMCKDMPLDSFILPFIEILETTGDINAIDDRGHTLLMTIAYTHYKGIKLLLSHPNILINQKNSAGFTALMYASNYGNIEGIQSLLSQSEILVNEKEKSFGFTALIMASQYGTQATRVVLTHPKVLVNEEDTKGKTALVFAAILGNIKTVKLLLKDHRMDLKENNQGEKALKETSHTKIKALIEVKMREQGIEF